MRISKRNFYFFFTGVLFLFPVFNLGLRNISIFAWAATAVYCIIKEKKNMRVLSRPLEEKILSGLLVGLFILLVVSLLYTQNFKTGLFSLEKRLSLLAFPLLIFLSPYRFGRKTTELFLNILIASSLFFLLYSACVFLVRYNPTFKWENIEVATVHFRHLISSIITNVHPTYQAAWFFYSALLCFYFMFLKKELHPKRFFYLIPYIIFVSWGIFLAARTPFIGFLVTTVILVLSSKLPKAFKGAFLLLFICGTVSLSFLPSIKNRVNEVISTAITPPVGTNYNSVNTRVGIFRCSISVIQDNWLLGVGVGDVQDKLDICYKQFNSEAYSSFQYNTHNQYLHSWLSAGIFELLCLLAISLVAIFQSIKFQSFPLLAFIVFISICFLTENFLARNDGILLYSIVLSVLGIGTKKDH